MRRFYAPEENFTADQVTLSVEESRHLRDVLRLRAGDVVHVFDGAGREFSCRIGPLSKKVIRIAPPLVITPAEATAALDLLDQAAARLADELVTPIAKRASSTP